MIRTTLSQGLIPTLWRHMQSKYSGLVILLLLVHLACSDSLNESTSISDETSESQVLSDHKMDESVSKSHSSENQDLTCSIPNTGWDPNGVHKMSGTQQFEGWYYRITEPNRNESWVIITAYWRDRLGESRAFIELIQGSTGATYKKVFDNVDIEQIQANPGVFELWMGDVFFSEHQVNGSFIDESGVRVSLDFNLEGCALWGAPEDARNRWTMGWVTELPGPPLKWHVHHLKGAATGEISVHNEQGTVLATQFQRAPIHQEKNWGNAFPKRWIWMQSNVFEGRPDVAFAAAGGPVFGFDLSPSGYMMGLRWQDQFFNWRTQDSHQFKNVSFDIEAERGRAVWTFTAESLRFKADVKATAPITELIAIDVPADGGLAFGAFEHLNAELSIDLYQREGLSWRLVDHLHSSRTAVEAGGEFVESILSVPKTEE